MDSIAIHTEEIQLNQLLKLADAVSSGGQVKFLLAAGAVSINGAPVAEIRRKVRLGDIVAVKDGGCWKVVKAQGD